MTLEKAIEVLTDNFISIALTCTIVWMCIYQIPVPEWMVGIYGAVIAFYFRGD